MLEVTHFTTEPCVQPWFVFVCLSLFYVYVCIPVCALGDQHRLLDGLELELEAIVSHLVWALGTDLTLEDSECSSAEPSPQPCVCSFYDPLNCPGTPRQV